MTTPHETDPDTTRVLVEHLVAASGIPASADEIEALVAGAPAVRDAVQRLYAVPMDHETEPGVEFHAR